jgi:hypothetical protein
MTRAALRGDLTDAWAWVQAGIWPDAEPTSPTVTPARILDALIATPEAAPGIVADAAAAGRLDLLLARELLPRWRRLADAVARSHDVAPSGGTPLRVALELPKAGARAAIRSAAVRTAYDREIVRQLLRIAIVAEAPSRPASWLRWALAALNESIELAVPTESSEPRALPSPARSGAMATGSSATRTIAVRGAVTVRLPAPAGQAPAALDPGVEPGAATEWGGLLFLIHVVKEIDLPGRHRTGALGEAPARQSLRWVLHQLATTLLALDPADPAALAFAGLGPDEPPPPQDEPPADAADSTPLAAVAEEITAALRVRLQATELTVDELMDTVCRRAARVVCDPGWIEIRLALDEVRTDVRRAGLDLDPGWLPFLGVVLRFTYE